jgi:hypothetical protein
LHEGRPQNLVKLDRPRQCLVDGRGARQNRECLTYLVEGVMALKRGAKQRGLLRRYLETYKIWFHAPLKLFRSWTPTGPNLLLFLSTIPPKKVDALQRLP